MMTCSSDSNCGTWLHRGRLMKSRNYLLRLGILPSAAEISGQRELAGPRSRLMVSAHLVSTSRSVWSAVTCHRFSAGDLSPSNVQAGADTLDPLLCGSAGPTSRPGRKAPTSRRTPNAGATLGRPRWNACPVSTSRSVPQMIPRLRLQYHPPVRNRRRRFLVIPPTNFRSTGIRGTVWRLAQRCVRSAMDGPFEK